MPIKGTFVNVQEHLIFPTIVPYPYLQTEQNSTFQLTLKPAWKKPKGEAGQVIQYMEENGSPGPWG